VTGKLVFRGLFSAGYGAGRNCLSKDIMNTALSGLVAVTISELLNFSAIAIEAFSKDGWVGVYCKACWKKVPNAKPRIVMKAPNEALSLNLNYLERIIAVTASYNVYQPLQEQMGFPK
jgi:hypothetical protein